MKKRTRLKPDGRFSAIMKAAVRVAERDAHVTRRSVAKEAGVSPALVSHYLGTSQDLRWAVVTYRAAVAAAIAGDAGAVPAAQTTL